MSTLGYLPMGRCTIRTDHACWIRQYSSITRDRLSVSTQTMQKFDMEAEEQYLVAISKRFAALENLDNTADINKA
jgi:hypothetical protein